MVPKIEGPATGVEPRGLGSGTPGVRGGRSMMGAHRYRCGVASKHGRARRVARQEGDSRMARAEVRRRARELRAQSEAEIAALHRQVLALTRELSSTSSTLLSLPADRGPLDGDQAQLAAIVRASDDAIYSMATDTTVTTWNAGAERLLGYSAEEIVGRSARSLVPEDELQSFEAGLAGVRQGEPALSYDAWRLHREGSRVEVSVSLSGMRKPDGSLTGFCAVVRDLAPRRQIEAVLARFEAERQLHADHERIARNLNDLVINRIFAASLATQSAANIAGPEAGRRLSRVVKELDVAITELRSAIFGLRVRSEDQQGAAPR